MGYINKKRCAVEGLHDAVSEGWLCNRRVKLSTVDWRPLVSDPQATEHPRGVFEAGDVLKDVTKVRSLFPL